MQYGEGHVVYGSARCPHCGQAHAEEHWIKETAKSRFRLLQFAAEMTAFESRHRFNSVKSLPKHAPRDAGGVQPDGRVLVDLRANRKLLKDLPGQIRKTQKLIETMPNYLDQNTKKLADLRRSQKDATIARMSSSFERQFPGVTPGYSPVAAASQKKDDKFMLGILISGGTVLVTTSGGGVRTNAFKDAAALKKMEICGEVEGGARHQSLGGRPITATEYLGTKAGMGYEPGNCAAPRLLARALAMPEVVRNRKNWAMSEVYYYPNNDLRRAHEEEMDRPRLAHVMEAHPGQKGDPGCPRCRELDRTPVGSLYWVPGLSAHSCETCENLVPLLLCPRA